MQLNQAIFTQLSGYGGLSALISDRVYPTLAKQGTAIPFVVYQRITESLTYTHTAGGKLSEDLLQFDCYGLTADAARAVAVQLKKALDSWTTPTVNRAFIVHDQEFYEQDTKLFRVSVDAQIWNALSHP